MRVIVASSLLLAFAMSANAATLNEKLCVFQAAAKLPVKGASIGNAGIFPLPKNKAASIFAERFPQGELTKLGFVNYEPGMADISKAIEPQIAGSARVVLPVTVAGQTLQFTTDCIWNAAGQLISVSEGASD